jgi:prevent-host-death family protein
MDWRFADAKNKLSEVVTRAIHEEPQRIRRRDDTVLVVSQRDYDRMNGKRPDFKSFLLNGPDMGYLDLTRDSSPIREVEL